MTDCLTCSDANTCTLCKSLFLDTKGKGCHQNCVDSDSAKPSVWNNDTTSNNKICSLCNATGGNMTKCNKCINGNTCTECILPMFLDTEKKGCV